MRVEANFFNLVFDSVFYTLPLWLLMLFQKNADRAQ